MTKLGKMHLLQTIFLLLSTYLVPLSAQQNEASILSFELQWETFAPEADSAYPQYFPYDFEDNEYTGEEYRLPLWHHRISVKDGQRYKVELVDYVEEEINLPTVEWEAVLSRDFSIESHQSQFGQSAFINISLLPVRAEEGKIYRMTRFSFSLQPISSKPLIQRNGEYTMISELNEGVFYKIAIDKSGLYRLDRDYLIDEGINPDEIDPRQIQLFGNGGGKLPEPLEKERIDDLLENPLYFSGDQDGQFEEGEFFIFYAEGPDSWVFNPGSARYEFTKNIYDTQNYYFLRTDGSNGLRVGTRAQTENPSYTSSSFDSYQVHEIDRTNLLAQYDHTEGTGQEWFGESFFTTKQQDFFSYFNFDNRLKDEGIQVYAKFAARNASASTFSLQINEQKESKSINGVSVQSTEATYARNGVIESEIILNEDISSLVLSSNAYQGWLDKIVLNMRKPLSYENEALYFSDRFSVDHSSSAFRFSSTKDGLLLWDISKAGEVYAQEYSALGGNEYQFNYPSSELRTFALFDPAAISSKPGTAFSINKQNLHGIFDADMLIVYHENFKAQAEELAQHRRDFNGFRVYTADVEQIFNEFSSGRKDPTAIRDFAKMLYDRNPEFSYLLLFGDGSYDYRSILIENNNDDFIPVYETEESLNPISGYVSDDYFGLLSDNEGDDLIGDLDIAIGRLPVSSSDQASRLVDKIITYETSPSNSGDWQNRIALIADDEDFSRHLDQSEVVADFMDENHPVYNVEKIYLDAFQQEVNAGGQRYPEANKSINDNIFKGILAMTYIGHGGPGGFAQERVLKHDDIYSWNNENKLPLLITATCSFAGFDDPDINTAGEATILKENGGVIGLFSTVRLVYSNENSKLINSVYSQLFQKQDGAYLKLGDILKYAKNNIGNKDNKRKFFLFGDPAMQLAIPEYKVFTTSINDIDVTAQAFPDTLNALSKVKVNGYIGDEEGNIQKDFNGTVFTTVFDKEKLIETLGNDSGSYLREFKVRKQVLFKGSASVVDGEFSFEFILPKDIDYRYGNGKISYYYSNGDNKDANGFFTGITIGGSSKDEIVDDEGPVIDLYMNHTDFESGDVTNSRPVLLAFLSDESGINISGSSIGHDPGATLDSDQQQYYRLNDFFESAKDDYTSGSIVFPLDRLEPGLHNIHVEAWDILNNKGEASIEFIVADEEEQVLKNLFTYPNPFSVETFFHFEHTLPDSDLDVLISIYDLSGRRVKTIETNAFTDGHTVKGIKWDGLSDPGKSIPNGIYIYTIEVYSSVLGISVEGSFEKLVIIK
jgi:hypothetical protein